MVNDIFEEIKWKIGKNYYKFSIVFKENNYECEVRLFFGIIIVNIFLLLLFFMGLDMLYMNCLF